MPDRQTKMRPAEAARFLKAVKAAGFRNGRVIAHPDGRIELIGEDAPSTPGSGTLSPFEKWEAENADKA